MEKFVEHLANEVAENRKWIIINLILTAALAGEKVLEIFLPILGI